ncbi:tyrosine-protein kinase domain-containing protein [Lacimicrobium sp. SS2-24]|uniref:GumC family protein n=1 Tax=Lacimicrobium sp. SS2-24 TaxID=2005569 RepID=UPI000B4AD9F8|nr:tyrosine-protein kinase domain-containing protein [Lacimicrobium sp. SS2-24]
MLALEKPQEQQLYQSSSFSAGQLLLFMWNQKWRIIIMTIAITVLLGYFILQLPKVYQASSTLLLGGADKGMPLSNLNLLPNAKDAKMETYIEFMHSRAFAQILIDELTLRQKPEYGGSDADVLRRFQANLSINQVRNTDMLKVSFSSYSPKLAQRVANSIGPAFFAFHARLQQQKVLNSSERLNIQLVEIQARLSETEQNFQQYLDNNNIVDLRAQMGMLQDQVSELVKEQLKQQQQLSEARIHLSQIKASGDDYRAILSHPWVIKSPQVEQSRRHYITQSNLMAQVTQRYKHKHPKYQRAARNLAEAEQELHKRVDEQVIALSQFIQALESRNQELSAAIAQNKKEIRELGEHQLTMARLEQEMTGTQKIHEAFMAKLQEMEMLKDMGDNKEFAVVDKAPLPDVPSKPNTRGLIFFAACFACVFSTGFWFVVSLIGDQHARLLHEVKLLDLPVLAMLPKIGKVHRKRKNSPLRARLGETDYHYSEGIRALRTAILINHNLPKKSIIAITSVKPRQGKASIVSNLADSLSNIEPVLLADIDLRAPSMAKAYNLEPHQPGLTELLDGKARINRCLYRRNNNRLTLLPSGAIPADPLALISTNRFRDFLRRLNDTFPRILMEAPPVQSVSDALMLSRLANGVIVVCDMENTQSGELTQMVQNLRETNTLLLGVVLNKVKKVTS